MKKHGMKLKTTVKNAASLILAFTTLGALALPAVMPAFTSTAKSAAVTDSAPPVPCITKFSTQRWDAGWYRMESGLEKGTAIYSVDTDPNGSESKNDNEDKYHITELPERFIGCDYIINRKQQRKDIFFTAEQDINIYAAIDSGYGSSISWLAGWESTGEQMKISDGTVYNIYRRTYSQGVVTVSKLGSDNDGKKNFFLMALPVNGKTVTAALTNNEVINKGVNGGKNSADAGYSVYLEELYTKPTLPEGNTVFGISGSSTVTLTDSQSSRKEINLALNSAYTTSGSTRNESPVDGSVDTYWQGSAAPGFFTVDLGQKSDIHKITLKLRDYWEDRTENIGISVSDDGASFTELVKTKDYTFKKSETNIISLDISATFRYIKITINSNTGNAGGQLSELEVYGYETTGSEDRSVRIEKTDRFSESTGYTYKYSGNMSGALVLETRVMPHSGNINAEVAAVAAADGKKLFSVCFNENGYITVGGHTLCTYTSEKWYAIEIHYDTDSGRYSVSVNHIEKAAGLEFTEKAEDAASVSFALLKNSTGSMDVGYLKLYDETECFTVNEGFDSYETGSAPKGWTLTGSAVIAEVPFKDDKSLKLDGSSSNASATVSFSEIDEILTVEAKIKAESGAWVTAPVVCDKNGVAAAKVAFYRNSIFVANGDNWVYLCDDEVANNYYGADNWYYVKLVIDIGAKRYDTYIDGAKRYSGAAFINDVTELSSVTFRTEESNLLYVDAVKVYDSASLSRGMYAKNNVFNVRDFGAVGDGVTDDTKAIDKAVNAASVAGGTVLLENGVFYTGQITLKSNVTLYIDATAEIFANQNRNVYKKVVPSNGYNGNKQLGRGIIYFENAENVTITGGGTINGNGFYGFNENDPSNQRPCVIYFAHCDDVKISNINIVQSPYWTIVPYESSDFTIKNVSITNHVAPNRDGIDPVNSDNYTVENCKIIAGDDAFCPKSGNSVFSGNAVIKNCYLQSYCNGIKFGTDTQGPFYNYVFEDICMKGVGMSGITLQSVDGSDIRNISFRRIDMSDVDNAIFLVIGNRMRTPYNVKVEDYKKLGSINGVSFEDISFVNCMKPPYSHKTEDIHEVLIYGLNPEKNTLSDGAEHRISNVSFKNVYLEMPGGKNTVRQFYDGLATAYPEHDVVGSSVGYGYTVRWADNVTFENCTTVLEKADKRKETAMSDYTSDETETVDNIEYALGNPEILYDYGTAEDSFVLPETVDVLLDSGEICKAGVKSWKLVSSEEKIFGTVYTYSGTLVSGIKEGMTNTGKKEALIAVAVLKEGMPSVGGNDIKVDEPENKPAGNSLLTGVMLTVAAAAVVAGAALITMYIIRKKKKNS